MRFETLNLSNQGIQSAKSNHKQSKSRTRTLLLILLAGLVVVGSFMMLRGKFVIKNHKLVYKRIKRSTKTTPMALRHRGYASCSDLFTKDLRVNQAHPDYYIELTILKCSTKEACEDETYDEVNFESDVIVSIPSQGVLEKVAGGEKDQGLIGIPICGQVQGDIPVVIAYKDREFLFNFNSEDVNGDDAIEAEIVQKYDGTTILRETESGGGWFW